MKNKNRQKGGVGLVVTILFMIIVAFVIAGSSTSVTSGARMARDTKESVQSLIIAMVD